MAAKRLFSAVALVALWVSSAHADVLIDFDQVTTNADVWGFYNGGTDGAYYASGPNLGVYFVNFTASTGFGVTSQPNFAYNSGSIAAIDYAAGFTAVSFTYRFFSPGTFSVYSELDGTGSLLGTVTLGANPSGSAPGSVPFSGVGKSILLSGAVGFLGIDDLRLSSAVPEPSTWAMMILGFCGLGFMAYRRKLKPALMAA